MMKHTSSYARYSGSAIAAVVMMALGGPAVAAETPGWPGGYVGVETVNAKFSIDQFEPTDEGTTIHVPSYDLSGLSVTGGYRFLPNFAIEGRFTRFSSESTDWLWVQEDGTQVIPVRVGIDTAIGVLAKGILPLAEGRVHLYGLAGYTRLRFSERTTVESLKGVTANGWDGSESLGAGAEFYAGRHWGFKLEFNRQYRRSTESFDTTHIGALFRF